MDKSLFWLAIPTLVPDPAGGVCFDYLFNFGCVRSQK
jgi:hypothetical protein